MSQRPDLWTVDPEDPRAPPSEVWEQMSEAERLRVVDSLPSEFPVDEARPPEGDEHTEQVYGTRTALRRFFGKTGRRVYVGTNLPVYYPGERMFSPDVIAVLDVENHPRSSWMVDKEGKGLDFALEVMVLGHRKKDLEHNVEYYARLGIAEYFVFDRPRLRLQAYQLRTPGQAYEPVLPQHGHYASRVLGLDLVIEQERLRFYAGDAKLPGADDLIEKLEGFVDELDERIAQAETRAEEEARRAELAEARLQEALQEIDRLKRQR